MKKSIILALTALSIIATTPVLAASTSREGSVICPDVLSITCTNTGNLHFYGSNFGFPKGGWTSNSVSGSCPRTPPLIALPLTSTSEDGAEGVCTYYTAAERIELFQASKPNYCVSHGFCPPTATPTKAGGCVKFEQDSCTAG